MITNHIIKLNSLRGSILFADPTSAILTLFSFYSKFAFTYTDAIFYSLFPSLSRSKEWPSVHCLLPVNWIFELGAELLKGLLIMLWRHLVLSSGFCPLIYRTKPFCPHDSNIYIYSIKRHCLNLVLRFSVQSYGNPCLKFPLLRYILVDWWLLTSTGNLLAIVARRTSDPSTISSASQPTQERLQKDQPPSQNRLLGKLANPRPIRQYHFTVNKTWLQSW